MHDLDFPQPKIHLFVCVNDRSGIPGNTTPSCGPRIKPDDVAEVKRWIRNQGLTATVYCTKVKCLGFCHAGGSVACVYPSGRFIKEIQNKEDIKEIVKEEVGKL